ncbi:type IV pilus twitching motility protein PilT [Campylobacter concisus]|uniref:type IV pilus twitching motility protein PilT n=1 Tax=Campylobacter concisus TaxID=199 RepID=UPI000CD8E57E|nr:PilT/PilU family type 4a pilus ATPase [Campylobacter concisus]
MTKQDLDSYLCSLVDKGGSDLHLKSASLVYGRFNGEIMSLSEENLDPCDAVAIANELLGAKFDEFMDKKDIDFSYKLNDEYCFRVNMFLQINGISAVFRVTPTKIPTIKDLNLPSVIEKICTETTRGIILVTGPTPTGSGKTTTLASMINFINQTKRSHIVTIEDPIEYVFNDDKSIINQRSIGADALNFSDALRASLREDPDIILVGEMRDLETIETAIRAAETGHLVLSTLHTLDAKESVNRIVNSFPQGERDKVSLMFSSVLACVISQRLVKTLFGTRRPAVEIMRKNTRIKELISEEKFDEIDLAIAESKNTYGMQTFDQHLLELYENKIISAEVALDNASNRGDLQLKIKSSNVAGFSFENGVNFGKPQSKQDQPEVIALKEI